MSSAMISQTLQGAVLSITSNILAQAITSYKESTPFSINFVPVFKFALFSIISNPPNIIWQNFLEDLFPTNIPLSLPPTSEKKPTSPAKTRTSKTNILIKFLLDQTIGAVINTLMFLGYMGYVNASASQDAWGHVATECRNKTWPMMKDGYKFWPAISLISFVWVPVDKRVVFGCSVGVIWGIYLSLMVDA
ncbi:Nn.00g093030.m01.CDS01 [Neocucurbitaria sp. VM-36]